MMSYTIPGNKLPKGTLVYVCVHSRAVRRTTLCRFTVLNKFIFDICDELYATKNAREFWKSHPELHPHATLFEMLYKKLDSDSDTILR